MSGHQVRVFLNRLVQQLELGPAWLHHEPPCALWLDSHGRVNVCTVSDYAMGAPLARISINKIPLLSLKNRDGWPGPGEVNPARPDWRLELVCQSEETGEFVNWLASVVNRREGYLRRLPPPPYPLLHWESIGRLDDYLYYLSAVSLWSENGFHDDLRRGRQPVTPPVYGSVWAPAAAH